MMNRASDIPCESKPYADVEDAIPLGAEFTVKDDLSLNQIAFNLLASPYYCEAQFIEEYSRYTSSSSSSSLEKSKLMQMFFEVTMKAFPSLSAVCCGSKRIAIRAHEFDSSTIEAFKTIFSLSDADVALVVDNSVESHFPRPRPYSRIELLQEALYQYTRMYPCSSILQFF